MVTTDKIDASLLLKSKNFINFHCVMKIQSEISELKKSSLMKRGVGRFKKTNFD